MVESVLCIPGRWKDRQEFIFELVKRTQGEYIAAGNVVMHVESNRGFEIDFCEHDEKLRVAFDYAGRVNRVSDRFLQTISEHRHIVYLIGKGGTLIDAQHIARAGNAILKSGGLGVKVETAGKAFEKEQWSELVDPLVERNLYRMFVLDSIVSEDGLTYSCGMHNLGLRDTIVIGENFQESVDLITVFSFYMIVDKPIISEGQTFSRDLESPKFRIVNESRQPNMGSGLFENPYGMWRLTRV